jgi:hypothetical protein
MWAGGEKGCGGTGADVVFVAENPQTTESEVMHITEINI